MSWAIGYDENWKRDIGYGVPAICDRPGCNKKIHRGLAYVCGDEPFGGEAGCGLFFCIEHKRFWRGDRCICGRCNKGRTPYAAKPDVDEWTEWKRTHPSWAGWRAENGIPEPSPHDECVARLQDIYTEEEAKSWMDAPNKQLGGISPSILIDQGEHELVRNTIQNLF